MLFFTSKALAQQSNIIPDNTLGAESSRINRNVNVNGINADSIDKGARRGSNLFHSFSEFNINDGQNVYFANPAGVENILTRVTGGNASNIFGTLGVDGSANLFLINPSGIVFGENARLDVQGSFVGTTANGVQFGEQGKFSATNPEAPPLLKISITPGLQYGKNQPSKTIKNTGNLTVGKNLTLFAGNLDLQGRLEAGDNLNLQAIDTVKIRDSVTNPFIAKAGGKLLVQGNKGVNIFALSHPSSGLFSLGDMVLRSANPILGDAHYWSGGNFQIQQPNGDLGELYSDSDLIIRSAGDVSFFGYVGASLHILTGGSVDINTVIINGADTTGNTINPQTTPKLANVTLSDGTSLVIDGTAKPTLDIRAGMKPEAISIPLGTRGDAGTFFASPTTTATPPVSNPVATSANITIGDIRFDAPDGNVLLTNQYQPNSSLAGGDIRITQDGLLGFGIFTSSAGSLSNVTIDSRSKFTMDGRFIYTSSSMGNSGDINMIADSIAMTNGAAFLTSSSGIGDAGNVNITARDSVSFDGFPSNGLPSSIFSNTLGSQAQGKAGDITISTKSLSLTNGAAFSTSSSGIGDAGNVNITAHDFVSLDGFANNDLIDISSSRVTGGDINISTGSLYLTNGARLGAGNINITARDNISLDGFASNGVSSGISTTLGSQAQGKAGDINISTKSLSLTNGAIITTFSSGIGDAGNVKITAHDFVSLDGLTDNIIFNVPSSIATFRNSQTQGKAGDITINTGSLFVINGASLNATNFGMGNAGKITIMASDTVSFDGFRVTSDGQIFGSEAFTVEYQGTEGITSGGIEITTGSLSMNGAVLNTSTKGDGDGGDVKITARDSVFLNNGRIFTFSLAPDFSSSVNGNAGDINITTSSLVLTNVSALFTSTFGNGNAGDIQVNATDFVSVKSGSSLSSTTSGQGNGGNIEITAGNTVTFDGVGFLDAFDLSLVGLEGSLEAGETSTSASTGVSRSNILGWRGRGKGGDIRITTGSLFVTNGAFLNSATEGEGDGADAGNIIIRANDLVSFDGDSTATTSVLTVLIYDDGSSERFAVTGDGGDIDIQARSLSVTNGAILVTGTLGAGKAGDIRVNTTESVTISGVLPVTDDSSNNTEFQNSRLATGTGSVDANATGEGGKIDIQTGVLKISDGGALSTRSFQSVGKAGDITVNVNELELTAGGKISTITRSTGVAGNITVNARDKITISGVDTRFELPESGLFADSLSSQTTGAGNITVNSPLVLMDNQGRITTENTSSNGGNISLEVKDLLLLRNNSLISTTAGTAQAGGDGGNININSKFIVAIPKENSDISANAFLGRGGKVQINSRGIFGIESRSQPTGKSDITASSQQGIAGETNVNADDTSSIENSFTELPPNIDTDAIIANSCIVRGNQQQKNSFYITGSGALPPNRPGNGFVSNYITGEVRGVATKPRPSWKKGDPIIEPQGLYRLNNGQLLLSRECSN